MMMSMDCWSLTAPSSLLQAGRPVEHGKPTDSGITAGGRQHLPPSRLEDPQDTVSHRFVLLLLETCRQDFLPSSKQTVGHGKATYLEDRQHLVPG